MSLWRRCRFWGSRTDWFSFSHAFFNNPVCCPTRATLLTGQYSHHTGVENVGGAPRFDDRSTIATWLHDGGYHTGFFGKWHLGRPARSPKLYVPPGWDEYVGWKHIGGDEGNEAYYGYTLNENGTSVQYGSAPSDYSTDVLANKAVDFLDRAAADGPRSSSTSRLSPAWALDGRTEAPGHVQERAGRARTRLQRGRHVGQAGLVAGHPLRTSANTDSSRRKQWDTLLAVDDAVKEIYSTLERHQILNDTVIVFHDRQRIPPLASTVGQGKSVATRNVSTRRCLCVTPGLPLGTISPSP